MDFRLFLLRHTELLRALSQWQIRLLMPPTLVAATTSYLRAARDHLAAPLERQTIDALRWFFQEHICRTWWVSPEVAGLWQHEEAGRFVVAERHDAAMMLAQEIDNHLRADVRQRRPCLRACRGFRRAHSRGTGHRQRPRDEG
jgi:hypothetical protein